MVRSAACLALFTLLAATVPAASRATRAQQPESASETITADQLGAAIDRLGNLEFRIRNTAARTVRRAPSSTAVPALIQAVNSHADGYVRFRALVLLSGFNDPRTRDVMAQMFGEENDRLRSVAYTWFERNRDQSIVPRLVAALDREESEFVRPPLTRALAAYGDDPRVRKLMPTLVMRGQAFFRSVVIEALGDYRAAYATGPVTEVARIDGPLQDDAALSLGKMGDKGSLPVLARLQQSAPRESQPAIAAAICLLGVNCASHHSYITRSLEFSIANIGFQELLRGSASALAALGAAGKNEAIVELVELGAPTRDPARAAIALAVGTVALRNTAALLDVLERTPSLLPPATGLLREAFDMLEEDFEEERFYVTVRRAYWQAPEGSPRRRAAESLIAALEF